METTVDSDGERLSAGGGRVRHGTAEHNSALPRSLCLWQGEGGPRPGRAAAQSLALTVTESRRVYTAQESTIPAG